MGNAYASYPVFALNASKGSLIYGGGTNCRRLSDHLLRRWAESLGSDERTG